MHKNRFYIILYFPAICSVVSLLFLSGCSDKNKTIKKPPKVIVAKAYYSGVNKYREYVGQVVSIMKEVLSARVVGYLSKRTFTEGSFVKKGDLLFNIQKDEYQADVVIAEGNLTNCQAALKNAEIEYDRYKLLSEKKATSIKTFNFAEAAKGKAVGDVEVAKGNLALAKLNLSYTDIISPCNGRIGKVTYNVGNLVGPKSNPLATVLMFDPIYVEFNINEAKLLDIIKQARFKTKLSENSKDKTSVSGVKVILKLSNNTEYPYSGSIDFIDNRVNPTTGTVLLRAIFKNPNELLVPGSFVTVKVETIESEKEILIPQSALQQDQLGSYVYVLNKDKEVVQKHITIGAFYGTDVVVEKGVTEGEDVISQGFQKVKPGIKVIPVEKKPKAKNSKNDSHNTKNTTDSEPKK